MSAAAIPLPAWADDDPLLEPRKWRRALRRGPLPLPRAHVALAYRQAAKLPEHVHADIYSVLLGLADVKLGERQERRAADRLSRYLAWHLPLGGRRERRGLRRLIARGETRQSIALAGVRAVVERFAWDAPLDVRFGSAGNRAHAVPPFKHLVGPAYLVLDYWFIATAKRVARELLRRAGDDDLPLDVDRPDHDSLDAPASRGDAAGATRHELLSVEEQATEEEITGQTAKQRLEAALTELEAELGITRLRAVLAKLHRKFNDGPPLEAKDRMRLRDAIPVLERTPKWATLVRALRQTG